jgi:hypothetical protein
MTNEDLVKQIEKLNKNLDELMNRNSYMVFSADKKKFLWYNVVAGFTRSVGSFIGTLAIGAVVFFILSRLNIDEVVVEWLNKAIDQLTRQFLQIQKPVSGF